MRRRTLPLRDVPSFVTNLKEDGASHVRRHPPDVDGQVVVTWEPSSFQRGREAETARMWRGSVALTALTLAVMLVAAVVAFLLSFL